MIQLLPCPACRRETVLPSSASLDASICCPHCQARFHLGDLLRKEYGFWEVTDDPQSAPALQAFAPRTDVASSRPAAQQPEEFADEDFELSPVEPRGVRAVQPRPEPEKSADWSKFKPITHDQFERMKRKARSPLWSIFQVVLGGIAAVPIALLILWHGLGRDVMDAGPIVGQYVPWIVPQQFRPPNRIQDEQAAEDQAEIPKPGASGFRRFDDAGSQNASPRAANEAGNPAAAAEETPAASTDPAATSNAEGESKADEQASVESDEGAFSLQAAEHTAGQNIFAAIRSCEQVLVRWSDDAGDSAQQRRALAQSVYSELVSLALLIDQLPAGNPVLRVIRDQMQSIGGAVKRKPDIQDLIQQGAAHSLKTIDSDTRLTYGLAFIVENDQVLESSDSWEIRPTRDSLLGLPDVPSLKILVPKYLTPMLIAEQRLFLLGTLRREERDPGTEKESGQVAAPSSFVFEASYLYSFGH